MENNELSQLLAASLAHIPDPRHGLPDSAFHFILKLTPMINVDLLVKDGAGRKLLAWREDEHGVGWHIPGGIIRYREPWADRIAAVAEGELGAAVSHPPHPSAINEFFCGRGHFISLLFNCTLTSPFRRPDLFSSGDRRCSGALAWHERMPVDIYPSHEHYKAVLDA